MMGTQTETEQAGVVAPAAGVSTTPTPAAAGMVLLELAGLPPGAALDALALARLLHRSHRAIQRAVRRGQLPAGFILFGRRTWTAGTIQGHLLGMQAQALAKARTRDARRPGGICPKSA